VGDTSGLAIRQRGAGWLCVAAVAAAAAAAASRLSIGVMLAGAAGSDVVRVCGVAVRPGCGGKQMYHYSSAVVACSSCSAMVGLLSILSLQNKAVNIRTTWH